MRRGGSWAGARGGNAFGGQGPDVARSTTPALRGARLGVLLVLLAVSLAGPSSGQVHRTVAPAFTLTLLDGKTLRLADMRGSPVVLLFWAPW
jgi:hypothetical protein